LLHTVFIGFHQIGAHWEVAMALQESGEMYLETIFILSNRMPAVRAVDVADYMGYSKPSVSRAVGLLKKDGYITVDDDGFLSLTNSGRQVAEQTYERHILLTKFFVSLGVDHETASADACKIEHVISQDTFEAIKKHADLADL
jgi:DtxR family Mn-dependent transcriptional regulator